MFHFDNTKIFPYGQVSGPAEIYYPYGSITID